MIQNLDCNMNEKVREMAAGDYTRPAIERRIADLRQRRIGALEGLTTGESIKESLAKYKEYRNKRREKLKTTHRHVLEMVSYILNTEAVHLEEGIIDVDDYVENLTSFLSEGGKCAIAVCHQPMSPPHFESGRWTAAMAAAVQAAPTEETSLRCCITDGSSEYLSGRCVIVYRLRSNLSFELKQLLQETYYAYAEVDPVSKSALAGISDLVSRLHQPLMVGNKASWSVAWAGGNLSQARLRTIGNNFVGDFEDLCEFLSVTRVDVDNTVKLAINRELSEKYLSQDEKLQICSENTQVVGDVEETVARWMRIIERSIVASQQLRRETETTGPRAELIYWRRLFVRFSSIVEEFGRPQARRLLKVLVLARSVHAKKWKKLEGQVSTIRILSRENVKYLYALEKYTRPLYRLDPTEIGEYLSALVYAVKTIYATSRFFNTKRIVSPVFVKITNQLIVRCKKYLLTADGSNGKFWRDGKYSSGTGLIARMKDCINLCTRYHECYTEILAKERLLVNDSTEQQPDLRLSKMSVFGKFNTFKTRLNKVRKRGLVQEGDTPHYSYA